MLREALFNPREQGTTLKVLAETGNFEYLMRRSIEEIADGIQVTNNGAIDDAMRRHSLIRAIRFMALAYLKVPCEPKKV